MSSWTLAELVELAARALAADGVRVTSGRVAEVPNERLVRWYSTIGLVDRPMIGRGRTARYGERQLAQLIAVKRLQAQGLPLVEIQQRLVGATDAQLWSIAGVPEDLTSLASATEPRPASGRAAGPIRRLDDRAPTIRGRRATSAGGGVPAGAPEVGEVAGRPESSVVDGPSGREALSDLAAGSAGRFWETRPARLPARPRPVFGLALSGVTLLLPVQPSSADEDAIAAAVAPLIEVLASRGLLDTPKGSQ
jgi:DNA-binding transcriptional MerR regulator